MRTYTIQFEIMEGNDEFWDSNPKPQEVMAWILDELGPYAFNGIDPATAKIVKVVDTTIYTYEDAKDVEYEGDC